MACSVAQLDRSNDRSSSPDKESLQSKYMDQRHIEFLKTDARLS